MQIKLDECISLKRLRYFPLRRKDNKNYRYYAYVGLGSNINEEHTMKLFMKKALSDKRIFILSTSPVLINKPFGYTQQKDFHNAVLLIKTSKGAKEFLKILLHYESVLKRKRSFANAPRTLDLDVLYFDKLRYKDKTLCVPHAGAHSRASVFVPLGMMI